MIVYYDREKNYWWVEDTDYIYKFKSKKIDTGEAEFLILTWTRCVDMTPYPDFVRMYDIELEGEKFYFIMKPQSALHIIEPVDNDQLARLSQKNIMLLGSEID
jgi:hypothetical protein